MIATNSLLQTLSKRLDFWRAELQASFRRGDAGRAAECIRVIQEYHVFTELALTYPPADLDPGGAQLAGRQGFEFPILCPSCKTGM